MKNKIEKIQRKNKKNKGRKKRGDGDKRRMMKAWEGKGEMDEKGIK